MEKFIQVELAIGWPDHTWSDCHFVYVPETVGDPATVAMAKMAVKLDETNTACSFIVDYNINMDDRFTEDGDLIVE